MVDFGVVTFPFFFFSRNGLPIILLACLISFYTVVNSGTCAKGQLNSNEKSHISSFYRKSFKVRGQYSPIIVGTGKNSWGYACLVLPGFDKDILHTICMIAPLVSI